MITKIYKSINCKFITTLTALLLALAGTLQAEVIISEFMANNDETLVDGDGNYSDWIELYNPGTSAVDLTGWYLSDTTNNLIKWAFPSKSIAAGEFLLVFASGQAAAGYTDSLGYLHTNFKLSSETESVLLTQSDGVTAADSIIDYPPQSSDISYGIPWDSTYTTLVASDEDAKALVPTSDSEGDSWHYAAYVDTLWLSGYQGVGYDTGTDYASLIGLDVLSMRNQNASVYIRIPFDLAEADSVAALSLRAKYDDGFAAFLNGVKIAGANAPTTLAWNSLSTGSHEADLNNYVDFDVSDFTGALQDGANVLAIQGLNWELRSSDMLFVGELNAAVAGAAQTNTLNYLPTPTPGSVNVSGFLGYVKDTEFSVDRGFFTAATNVAITCDTEGASIYYTTDATEPSADNGTLYTTPIAISKTTVLRAVATKSDYQSSDVDSQSYIFLTDIIAQGTGVTSLEPYFPPSSVNGQGFDYGMDTDITQSSTYSGQIEDALMAIPSISMVTDPANLFDASSGIYVNASEEGELWERETSVELINPDGTKGFQINGGMRIRGESSTSSSNPKHSFRFIFDSEYGTSRLTYPLFGDEGADSFKRIDLRTGQNFSWANQTPQYATWLYDIFTRDTHHDMNQPHTRGEYYHLYINGMYWGLYQTEERCDSRYAESYYGDDNDDFDAVKADGDTGDMYAVDGTRDAYDTLWTGITAGVTANAAYFALQGKNPDGTENSSYTRLLDVDNVIDYMLLIYFTANRDSPIGPPNNATMPRNLTTVYNRTNPDGFKFVAHDNEHSLEITEGVNHNRFTQTLSSSFDGINRMTPWWMHLKLMNNAEYKLRFADHVHKHFFNNGALTANVAASRLAARRDEIYAAVVAESARWGDSKSTTPRTRDGDWLTSVNWLLNSYFLASPSTRSTIVLGQINTKGWYPTVAAPEFNQHGGSIASGFSLSISGTSQIYYTTDGSDPRAVGGSVTGSAYSSALNLTRSTLVKARTLSGGTWSALTEAEFIVAEESPLRITEIMYHPAAAGDGDESTYDTEDFEFIELLNTGASTIGLVGTEFTEGIMFNFSEGDVLTLNPGEYVVLVSDIDAFSTRYTNAANINIAGEYHGKFFIPDGALDNAGEALVLQDGLGNTIQGFEYKDSWYDITDGEGFSLTLLDPTAETNTWGESTSWRPSAYTGGTPGEGPVDFPSPCDMVINEALTHQDFDNPGDWVELYNSSTNSININGWFISDDADNLMKVELSGLSVIPPGGYLMLTEADNFGSIVAGTNGFALSELGEDIYISSGKNGALSGYRIDESFGAIDRDVTFGRHIKSDGTSDFTAQSATTYAATNAYPKVGPIVITEIMYHPADSNGFEYIELCNSGAVDAPLYNISYPLNTWKLDGAVEFTFPVGMTLSPGECIIITETNATAFTSFYSIPAGTTVLGPYEGKLANEGENVELYKPGDPDDETLETPYILVELVEYEDSSPWPAEADGGGLSLDRTDTTLYPNDSISWEANHLPSPGAATYKMADSDEDGMPDSWEIHYFGSISAANGGADEDWDDDDATNIEEWYAGTDPTSTSSVFTIKAINISPDCVLTWEGQSDRLYSLWTTTNLLDEFTLALPDIQATPPLNTTTIDVQNAGTLFFKLKVEVE